MIQISGKCAMIGARQGSDNAALKRGRRNGYPCCESENGGSFAFFWLATFYHCFIMRLSPIRLFLQRIITCEYAFITCKQKNLSQVSRGLLTNEY